MMIKYRKGILISYSMKLHICKLNQQKEFVVPPIDLKGLAMIFAGQENPYIIFRSKEIYIYFKRNNKIPINLLK